MDIICIFKLYKQIAGGIKGNIGKKKWLNSKRITLCLGAYIEGSISYSWMVLFNVNYAVWSLD